MYDTAIILRSIDTYVFLLLLYYSRQMKQPLLMEAGIGDNRHLIDIHAVADTLTIVETIVEFPGIYFYFYCIRTRLEPRLNLAAPNPEVMSNKRRPRLAATCGIVAEPNLY